MMIYRRRLPSFAAYWHLPEEITTEAEAVEFACHQARNGSGPLLLLVNRRESIEIDEDGVVLGRFTRSPENSLPYQRLGRHTFRFTLGPSGLQIEPSTEPRP